ncbi:MAG: hypothetical protein DCC55_39685 [Chloroflexi bacterium]|nr:MAG: hypothetical protein DCC55_39685 [Chloroflexota bacterium]
MKRYRILYVVLTVLTFAIVFGFWTVNQAYAKRLVATSDIVKLANEMIGEGEILHFTKTLYVRSNLKNAEPPDPYHMPLLPLLSAKPIVDIWLSPHIMHSITIIGPKNWTTC